MSNEAQAVIERFDLEFDHYDRAAMESSESGDYVRFTDHDAQLRAANELAERLKLEAQAQAQEAKTANSTIAEIYQLVSGKSGEPGNWHGAKPVLEYMRAANERIQPRTLDAPVSEPNLLSISEQRAVLADLMGLECLINRHDCWETEADARDMAECVPGHSKRRKELIEMGRAIIAADPDCWYDEQKAPFKLRYGESAAPTPRKGEHHE